MRRRSGVGFWVLVFGVLFLSEGMATLIPSPPTMDRVVTLKADDHFDHQAGRKGGAGWAVDYKKNQPGYALKNLRDPLLLEPGYYRVTFNLRRGHYPNKGLLHKYFELFRIEIWDLTLEERVNHRTLQVADFSKPNAYEPRWIDFSMRGRKGHLIEPRVYWVGLANAEVGDIQIDRYPDASLKELEDKAFRLGQRLEANHLENGFVVSRQLDGRPDEIGDAATYTGFYVTSLAWKYGVTKDELTYQSLENGINALHKIIKGTEDQPYLTRFIFSDGTPHPDTTSKDVYTSFFLAYKTALPFIRNAPLKKQMIHDIERIGNKFLEDSLTVKKGAQVLVSLTPYYTGAEIRSGIRKLFKKKDGVKKALKGLKVARSYIPFTEVWDGLKKTRQALRKKDEEALVSLVVPAMNGAIDLMERIRNVLREQYRDDLFPRRFTNKNYPGKQLEVLLTESLKKLPRQKRKKIFKKERFQRPSDLRILASNALVSLHIVRSAATITGEPQFQEYYNFNLYTQDALLQCALDWYGLEEDFTRLSAGNPAADRLRKGYLSLFALYNLIQMETNPALRDQYQTIFLRWWETYRNEDNPIASAIAAVLLDHPTPVDALLHQLDLYDENQRGFGNTYWKENGTLIGNLLGGGIKKHYSREPIPISHRPRGSFLWQRNARRLKGDQVKDYPGTDYLFVYWFSRYHGLIPETPPFPNARRK